jgi:plasmid stabilization system protein ParE
MTYHVIIEPTAQREIRLAVRWISEHQSPTAAAKWYNGLIKKASTLKTHPTRCPVAAENDRFPEEIRELLYGKRRNKYASSLPSGLTRYTFSMSIIARKTRFRLLGQAWPGGIR